MSALAAPQTREDWIRERNGWTDENGNRHHGYLGATDIAMLAGKGFRDRTPYKLYHAKWGTAPEEELDSEQIIRMEIGNVLEPMLAEWFTRDIGIPVKRIETLRHPEYPFIGANPDFITVDHAAPVETKSFGIGGRDEFGEIGTDQIPDKYHYQLTMQMGIGRLNGLPITHGFLYAMDIVSKQRHPYFVEWDRGCEQLFAMQVEIGVDWWNNVLLAKKQPTPKEPDESMQRERYAEATGDYLIASDEDDDLIGRMMQIKPERAAICKAYDELKVQLLERIGAAPGMTSLHGSVKYLNAKPTLSVDWEAIALELLGERDLPTELVLRHTNRKPGSRRLLLPKGG